MVKQGWQGNSDMKEATSRIKINKLLEAAGWRFFADGKGPANIQLEPSVTIKTADLDSLGNDFEKTSKGFIDFLLLDSRGFAFIVLEAKSGDKNPLVGKEQARKYTRSQNCRFIIPLGERQRIDGLRVEVRGKSFDLFDVKHRVALHAWNGVFNGLALVVGFCLGETIGKDDEGTMLALADLCAKLL